MKHQRISRRQLERISDQLTQRDQAVLVAIDEHRFLTTRQIARFCFDDKPNEIAALRSTNRALAKLTSLALIASLERRIGGVRAGSGSFVWHLTEPGTKFLTVSAQGQESTKRQRSIEPSRTFLEHTLAIAEVHLQLIDHGRDNNLELRHVQLEPECWRSYLNPAGGVLRLKPDLAAVTVSATFEDYWLFEIDLATEPPSRIVRKCLQYQEYRNTGSEQKTLALFPAVVWIVPTTARKDQLLSRLSDESGINTRLFTVITIDQLADLVTAGPEQYRKQMGGQNGGEPS